MSVLGVGGGVSGKLIGDKVEKEMLLSFEFDIMSESNE